MIKPIAPEVAKRFLEDYYHKLAIRTENRFNREDMAREGRRKLSKSKRRCVSFNQTELQRNKLKSGDAREGRTHVRRMSVDVGLFLGQKELQVRPTCRSPLELSPTQGSLANREEESNSGRDATVEVGERQVKMEDNKISKFGGRKKGSKKLKRSERIDTNEVPTDSPSPTPPPQPQAASVPAARGRQGMFNRRSLRKTVSDDVSGVSESDTVAATLEKQTSLGGGGKAEKKSKFTSSFPRRQWSWKSKKADVAESEISQNKTHLHQRTCSDAGERRKLSRTSLGKEEGAAILENNSKDADTSLATQVGDSWSSPTPSRAFTKHTSL